MNRLLVLVIGCSFLAGTASAPAVASSKTKHTVHHSRFGFVPPPPATMPSPTALAMVQNRGFEPIAFDPPKPIPLIEKVKLVGIICDTAILSGPAGTFRLQAGETHDALKLTALTGDSATVQQGSDKRTLFLN